MGADELLGFNSECNARFSSWLEFSDYLEWL
jgi:hypothetical protein